MAESRVNQSNLTLITLGPSSSRVTQSKITLITGGPMPVVSCNNPPAGTVGASYVHDFTASLGNPPYVFSISAGALPTGLIMNAAGHVSGVIATSGTFNFQVHVLDSTPRTAVVNCSILVG